MVCHPSDLWRGPCPLAEADDDLIEAAKKIAAAAQSLKRHNGWKVIDDMLGEAERAATRVLSTSTDPEEREVARRRLVAYTFLGHVLDALADLPKELETRREPRIMNRRGVVDDPALLERAAMLAEALQTDGWNELMAVIRGMIIGWRVLLPDMPADSAQWVIEVITALRSILARVREAINRAREEGVA